MDEVLLRDPVDLAAVVAWIHEGSQANTRRQPGAMAGDLTIKLCDTSERKIIRLDRFIERQLRKLGHQGPVPADGTLDQTRMGKPVNPALAGITGRRREHEREIRRFARLSEAPFDCKDELVGCAYPNEAGNGDGIPVPNNSGCFGRRDDLVLHRSPSPCSIPLRQPIGDAWPQ